MALTRYRRHPRVRVDTIARIVLASGDVEYGRTSDISLDGVGLSSQHFNRLDESFHPSLYAPCELQLSLFDGRQVRKIHAVCMINNLVPEAESYRIGLNFTKLSPEDEAFLRAFIDYQTQREAGRSVYGRAEALSIGVADEPPQD